MDSKISSIVLGCTHYPFVKNAIEKVVGQDVDIIDGSLGTARELMRRLKEKDLLNDSKEKGTIEMINSTGPHWIIFAFDQLTENAQPSAPRAPRPPQPRLGPTL